MKSLLKEMESKFKELEEQDQDKDGDKDFADVMIARMVASGVSKEDAIKKVKEKQYNEQSGEGSISVTDPDKAKELADKGMDVKLVDEGLRGALDEPYYIEVSLRDARKALNLFADKRNGYPEVTIYGSNVYASFVQSEIEDLMGDFGAYDIEVLDSTTDWQGDFMNPESETDMTEQQNSNEEEVPLSVEGESTDQATAMKKANFELRQVKMEYGNIKIIDRKMYQQGRNYIYRITYEIETMDEMSTSSGAGAYNTPKAFSTPEQARKKKKMKYAGVAESMDKKYEQLIESYKKFALGDSKSTPDKKVKETIKEVSKKLQEIEQLVRYSSRLKTESGLSREGYGPSVDKALTKISERLVKISERVRALGE